MNKKYKKSTRPEKSTKKVQNPEIVKKKYSTFNTGNTAFNNSEQVTGNDQFNVLFIRDY